ncbi:MAG: hypothetical protein GYB31_11730 [Bacteroidetes bacterium]|nr:hypothetical protein [Bacteroidota bacterium]
MAKKLYKETSRFKGLLFYGLTGLLFLLTAGRLTQLLLAGEQLTAAEWIFFLLTLLGLGALVWYVSRLRMKLSVTEKGISYKLSPLHSHKQRIPWEEVESYRIVKTPIAQQFHGGNITFNHEKRFSTNGRNGVEIHTRSGDVYFLGSNRPGELKKALKGVFKRNK